MNQMDEWFLIATLISVSALIIVCGGFWWWQKRKQQEQTQEQVKTYTSLPIIEERFQERVHSSKKEAKQQAIRAKNIARRKATLGYGLKSRHFKPRPAFEKKMWKLDAKPEDEKNE